MYQRLKGGGSVPNNSCHCAFSSGVGVVFSAITRASTLPRSASTSPLDLPPFTIIAVLPLSWAAHDRSGGRHSSANSLHGPLLRRALSPSGDAADRRRGSPRPR